MPPEPLNYRAGSVVPPTSRLRRWASVAVVGCILGVAPALLLLEGSMMLLRGRDVRRGYVTSVGAEARWGGVALILWAAALPVYGWFEWERRAGGARRAAWLAMSVFVLLLAAGAACQGVAICKREARQEQEAADRLRELPAELRQQAQEIHERAGP